MNVATCGAIKGAVSALDLKNIKCQVQLCNTYHLHLRPGDEKVKQMGGLHKFYKVERSYPYRQRRISGVLSCKVEKY